MRSEQVRGEYQRGAAGLSPSDSAGRTALKGEARANTPPEVRAGIQAQRPGLGPTQGSGGTANRTNVRVNEGARTLGNVGRGLAVVTAVTAATDIATSDDPVRATGSNAGAIGGGIGGGELGATIGLFTPAPEITSPLGGLIGSAIGGHYGYEGGGALVDAARSPGEPVPSLYDGLPHSH